MWVKTSPLVGEGLGERVLDGLDRGGLRQGGLFDPSRAPVVRAQAGRLRQALERYYAQITVAPTKVMHESGSARWRSPAE